MIDAAAARSVVEGCVARETRSDLSCDGSRECGRPFGESWLGTGGGAAGAAEARLGPQRSAEARLLVAVGRWAWAERPEWSTRAAARPAAGLEAWCQRPPRRLWAWLRLHAKWREEGPQTMPEAPAELGRCAGLAGR